jgi:protein SCO1/2
MSKTSNIRLTVLSCLVLVSLVIGVFVYSIVSPKELTKDEYKDLKFYELSAPRQLTDFRLQSGTEVFKQTNLLEKWHLVFMGFASCPDMCPMTMAKMKKTSNLLAERNIQLRDKINFMIVSVDPDRDTPELIDRYAKSFDSSFIGVSGDIGTIYTLATQLTLPFVPIVDSKRTDYDMDHSMNLALLSPSGRFYGFFKSPVDPQNMVTVLESVLSYNR